MSDVYDELSGSKGQTSLAFQDVSLNIAVLYSLTRNHQCCDLQRLWSGFHLY